MSDLTKRALEQSLKNLLLQKPLHKITISDIADDCGINRMTFYYHSKTSTIWSNGRVRRTRRRRWQERRPMKHGSRALSRSSRPFWRTSPSL